MNLLHFTLVLLIAAVVPPQLQEPIGTASIDGRVIRLGTIEPVSGVDLELRMEAQGGYPARLFLTKSGYDGGFVFRNLPAGRFVLAATRSGGLFVPAEFGQHGMLGHGVIFPVSDGQQMKAIKLEMVPTGTITGRILDADGRPIGQAAVMALTPMYPQGKRSLNLVQYVHSDDHGQFRFFSLIPGRYFVAAKLEDPTRKSIPLSVFPPGSVQTSERVDLPVVARRTLPTGEVSEETYSIVYFGGGNDPDRATPLEIVPDGTVGSVDILLTEGKTKSRHIRGTVSSSPGALLPPIIQVRAVPAEWSSVVLAPIAIPDTSGKFDLAGVVPGKYVLWATARPYDSGSTSASTLIGTLSVEVGDSDVGDVDIVPNSRTAVTGRVLIEGRPENDPALTRMHVTLRREPNILGLPSSFDATPAANGTFSIPSFNSDWRVSVDSLPPNIYVKSIQMGSVDLLSSPLHVQGPSERPVEIVLGTDSGSLDGRVINEGQQAAVNVTVVLVPETSMRRRWDLYKVTSTDFYGQFHLSSIPPGDYKAFAWEVVDDGAWQNPDFMKVEESRGKLIHIAASARETSELSVIQAKQK